jgi:nucleoside-diphosphate-sugar epimerase
MTEEWPTRPSPHFFYAREKAELEGLLEKASTQHPETELYLVRPPIVLGPDAFGAKVSARTEWAARQLVGMLRRVPVVPALAPDTPVQFIHQDDVAEALRLCVVGAGPAGAYNIAADDVLSGVEVARILGLRAFPLPGAPFRAAAGAVAKLPFLPSGAQWVEALSHPAIMDTTRARTDLGWEPRHSARDSLLETFAQR